MLLVVRPLYCLFITTNLLLSFVLLLGNNCSKSPPFRLERMLKNVTVLVCFLIYNFLSLFKLLTKMRTYGGRHLKKRNLRHNYYLKNVFQKALLFEKSKLMFKKATF
jgi:hypothetical protein